MSKWLPPYPRTPAEFIETRKQVLEVRRSGEDPEVEQRWSEIKQWFFKRLLELVLKPQTEDHQHLQEVTAEFMQTVREGFEEAVGRDAVAEFDEDTLCATLATFVEQDMMLFSMFGQVLLGSLNDLPNMDLGAPPSRNSPRLDLKSEAASEHRSIALYIERRGTAVPLLPSNTSAGCPSSPFEDFCEREIRLGKAKF